jgi:hypothetical protein
MIKTQSKMIVRKKDSKVTSYFIKDLNQVTMLLHLLACRRQSC